MKNKILIFIIGFLVGAIVASAGYIVYEKVKSKNEPSRDQFKDGKMQQFMMPDENMGTPPQMPSGEMPKDMPNSNEQNQDADDTNKQKAQDKKNKQIDNKTQNETSV